MKFLFLVAFLFAAVSAEQWASVHSTISMQDCNDKCPTKNCYRSSGLFADVQTWQCDYLEPDPAPADIFTSTMEECVNQCPSQHCYRYSTGTFESPLFTCVRVRQDY